MPEPILGPTQNLRFPTPLVEHVTPDIERTKRTNCIEQLLERFPGLSSLQEFFEGHRRMQQFKSGEIEFVQLKHRKGDLRSQLHQWDEHAKLPSALRSKVQVLELGCVDFRLLDRYFSTDLDLNQYARKSGAGPALMPVHELNLLYTAFRPNVFVVTGHSDCKAFNHALKVALKHRNGANGDFDRPNDVIAYSVIQKLRAELNHPQFEELVANLDEIHVFPNLQDWYAELNMAFTRGQLQYLLEQSELFREKVSTGELLLASAYQVVSTHSLYLDVWSLQLSPALRSDPATLDLTVDHFSRYHYKPVIPGTS